MTDKIIIEGLDHSNLQKVDEWVAQSLFSPEHQVGQVTDIKRTEDSITMTFERTVVDVTPEAGPTAEDIITGRLTPEQWAIEYQLQKDNPPIAGDYLRTRDGYPIRLEIRLEDGKRPFIFAKAYLCDVVGELPMWYARSINENQMYGLKCILLGGSTADVMKRVRFTSTFGGTVQAGELYVVRPSNNGTSLMVEVSKW